MIINGVSALEGFPKGAKSFHRTNLKKDVNLLLKVSVLAILVLYINYINLDYVKTLVISGVIYVVFMIQLFLYGYAQDKAKKENDI